MTKKTRQLTSLHASLRATYHKAHKRVMPRMSRLKKYLARKNMVIAGGAILFLLTLGYTTYLLLPRTVAFSYSQTNCFNNPVLLPGLITKNKSSDFAVKTTAGLAIMGYPVYSQTTCITPLKAPKEKSRYTVKFGNSLFKKSLHITTQALPALQQSERFSAKPISNKDPLVFVFNHADNTFAYRLTAGGQSVECVKKASKVSCDVGKLGLAQSSRYTFTLQRLFGGKVATSAFEKDLATVEAVVVVGSSITAGQLVYNAPTELTLTLNRTAEEFRGVRLEQISDATHQAVPTTAELHDKTLTIHFSQALPRRAMLSLSIEQINASDSGSLVSPYTLQFATSGGPKVVGVNIGSSRVSPTGSIVITFDSNVSATQAVREFVLVQADGNIAAATATVQGRKVTLKPITELPHCALLTVKVLDGLQNEFGVSGGSAWQFKSRVICQTVFSIGTSVQGRSITAYRFGKGPNKIIFVGGTHGNEKSSVYILNKWIDTLETNYSRIPANNTIIVIPNLNPDGFAANARTNAHNVDLNRNFPSNSWKSGVTMPDKSYLEYGGGTAPLSEPESRALANYVSGQGPRLVLTYHASGGVVVPNDSGDSNNLAHIYAQKSTVGYMGNSGTATFFEYDTTGAFEDWLHDKQGITALLIELLTKTGNEFSGHQNAMWAMAQL